MNVKNRKLAAMLSAFMAAVFYAISVPFSKILLKSVAPTYMASFLYLGTGIGIALLYALRWKREEKNERLSRKDLPYVIGMIVLDILAPIFLMIGVSIGSSSHASLLGNFEIVATSMFALFFFKEKIAKRLWVAIALITLSSVILSFDGAGSLRFSYGSLFVLLAASCWGLENNYTRSISDKSTYQIVTLKGLFSGAGSFLIANMMGETIPHMPFILLSMLLGFVAYGLSIFLYVRAQRDLGAAKTSAFYAVTPFLGVLLSFLVLGERLTTSFFLAFSIMIIGTVFIVLETLLSKHRHIHTHLVTHTHAGKEHEHTIAHVHAHHHITDTQTHRHRHTEKEIEESLQATH